MQDAETRTLWNHITGDAMHGAQLGKSLGPVSNLLHMTAAQALTIDAATRIAISDRPFNAAGRNRFSEANRTMQDRFAATLGTEDPRRPRMDLGLGIWTGKTARYYSVSTIRERADGIADRIDGRALRVYIDQESNVPVAVFLDARGRPSDERPQQMFTRWYGFALTFPGCEVFGG